MAIPSLVAWGALAARSVARATLATSFRRAVATATAAASAASSELQANVGRWEVEEHQNEKAGQRRRRRLGQAFIIWRGVKGKREGGRLGGLYRVCSRFPIYQGLRFFCLDKRKV